MKVLDRSSFGTTLYSAFAEKGYSVKDVADYMDISVQAVHSWINGTKLPTLDKIVILSDLLKISVDDLLPSMETAWKGATLNGKSIEGRLKK